MLPNSNCFLQMAIREKYLESARISSGNMVFYKTTENNKFTLSLRR